MSRINGPAAPSGIGYIKSWISKLLFRPPATIFATLGRTFADGGQHPVGFFS
ncbi:MAG: hypothetical protein IPK12_22300 [Gemmatimonadetes bacterium]|nr:hypothetical protein [Gemmatimonadota bacterium]